MGKYLKLFENHTQYEQYITGETAVLPNVSHCINEAEVHYNPIVPHDYTKDYLTFVAIEDGTFRFDNNGVSYSIDEGETWTNLGKNTNTPTITAGSKILWKGELTPQAFRGVGTFSSTGKYNVQGNIMSLTLGDNYNTEEEQEEEILMEDFCYYELFKYNINVVNAENLSLPATTLVNSCYSGMFQGCTSLTTAPELPATTLVDSCYSNMFYGCTNLNSITCLATDISPYACVETWVYNVSSNGTFTKAASMNGWTTGADGIPSGWVIENASE